jgi:chromosome segregation ATPase
MATNVIGARRLAGCFALLIAVTAMAMLHAQSTDTSANITPGINLVRVADDVKQLKVELLQMRIEIEQARLEALERELHKVEERLQSLSAEEESLQREVEDLQRQLQDPSLSSEQRAEISTLASETSTSGLDWLNQERVAVENRQSALRAQLAQTHQTRAQLLARATEMGIAVPAQTVRQP